MASGNHSMMFLLNAQLAGSFNSTFKSAQSALTSMQKEIGALNKVQSDIAAYQKQQGAIEATTKKIAVLQQQYDNIQREIAETGAFSSDLENKLLAKQEQIDKNSASLTQQTEKLGQMGAALNEAGVDTGNLAQESAQLGEKIEEVKRKQEEAADSANKFGSAASSAFQALNQAIIAAGVVNVIKEIGEEFSKCINASMEFESAMTGVAKTTDMSETELAAMAQEIKHLSTEIPIAKTELAGVAEVAGQLGIAKEDLIDFSTTMSMLATATTMAADEAATMLAQFANITQMDPSQYSNLASAVVDLGNNYATTEQKIVEMSQGIAASASLAGMSEADMVALSAAVTSLGIETQAGATSMSKLISELMLAVETGDDLNEMAAIANMSASEFTQAWGSDAVSALQAFVVGLNDTERTGKSATVVLNELGITETRMQRMVLSLANSGDLLNSTLETSNEAWAENTALAAEAEKRYGTTESRLIMLQNAVSNVQVAIGDVFTPTLKELYSVGTSILNSISAFIEKNPAVVKAITTFIVIVGVVTAVILAYTAVMKIATAVSAAFAAATGVALAPILAVVAAVAGAIALFVGIVSAIKGATAEYDSLTASSRQQYDQLQVLNAEYEKEMAAHEGVSERALELRYEIDELTAAYESQKQTLEEFIAETDVLIESHNKVMSSYEQNTAAMKSEEQGALALVQKLGQLSSKTSLTAAEQEQMKAIVSELNATIPDLGLSYSELTNTMNLSTAAIKGMVEAQAEQERQAENYRTWVELAKEELALKEQLAEAEENLRLRQEEMQKNGINDLSVLFSDYGDYVDEVDRLTAAYEENQAALAILESQAETYAAAQEEVGDGSAQVSALMSEVSTQMAELTGAYEEAYNAALSSVQGQYALWDEAAKVVAVSAGSINSALESQIGYWQDYNTNIAGLSDRGRDIEGLTEMIASFADGSTDSVNAVAGMASATDAELAGMVANWQTLQAEQDTVAQSLGQLEVDFDTHLAAILSNVEQTVADMDLNSEATASARNTIQGFINGATSMIGQVEAAYSRIAQAAMNAIDSKLKIHSPSREMEWRAEMTWAGYINKTEDMQKEVETVMSATAGAGTDAVATEAQYLVALAPQLMNQLSAMRSVDTVSADVGGAAGGNSISISLSPVYHLGNASDPEKIEEILRKHDEGLKDYILEVVDDAGIDTARRKFR